MTHGLDLRRFDLVDPTAPDMTLEGDRIVGDVDLDVLRGVPVATLFNGKQGGDVLLEALAGWLAEECGTVPLGMESKLVASQPAPGQLLSNMKARARLLVTGPGD